MPAAGRRACSGCAHESCTSGSWLPWHSSPSSPLLIAPERQPDELQQLAGFFVGLGRGDDRDVHAAGLVHLHVVDLREENLVPEAKRVVAAAVEALDRDSLEVAHARQRDADQAVEELVHPLAPQRDHRADRHALAHLEGRDRLLGAADGGFLAGHPRQLVGRHVHDLRVARGLAESHVDDDLRDLRDRHHVGVAELLLQGRHDVFQITLAYAVHLSTTPSHLRQIRTLRPSSSTLCPTRVWAPHSGHTSWTLLAWSAASRCTTPPLMFLAGLGRVWRLIRFTPSTMRRFFSATMRMTRPFLPRSFPVVTRTVSFFRIGVCRRDIARAPRARAIRSS